MSYLSGVWALQMNWGDSCNRTRLSASLPKCVDSPVFDMTHPHGRTQLMRTFHGVAVSPGLAIGPVWALDPRGRTLPGRPISPDLVVSEQKRLETALMVARLEAEAAEAEAEVRLGPEYAAILGAHARMIDDPTLRKDARERIASDLISAEHAVIDVLEAIADRLETLADAHLAARASDVRDILARILNRLMAGIDLESGAFPNSAHNADPCILLTHDLSPSQTARLDPGYVLGFATEAGGPTSHTAIVAAALEIPAVVGLGPFLDAATRRASRVIIDGDEGVVILDPDPATLDHYQKLSISRVTRQANLSSLIQLPAQTRDGQVVELLGNIEFLPEAEICRIQGAGGIGLFRTEFLYLNTDSPPTEAEQFEVYTALIRAMPGMPITIRTLDLGSDKLSTESTADLPNPNPALGLRSLRLSLKESSLFRIQIRALLRAATLGDIRVMFPLVSTVPEFRKARQILNEVAEELQLEGVACRPSVPVGAMIEVPAAALMADHLAKEVDFFSIGTNDLIQYTLAADRSNENVAHLYNAADPSVLRLIHLVVEAARPRNLPVNLCGSMGGEPLFIPLLLGLGLTQLSMPPHKLLEVKRVIRAVSQSEAGALAREVLALESAERVMDRLRQSFPVLDANDGLKNRTPADTGQVSGKTG